MDLLRHVRALCWIRTVLFQKSKYSPACSYPSGKDGKPDSWFLFDSYKRK